MSILITAREISKSYDSRRLLQDITVVIESDERIGLIGPNGAGKSTLLKILAGKIEPDDGELLPTTGLRVGYLEQKPELKPQSSLREIFLEGAREPEEWEAHSQMEELFWKMGFSDASLSLDLKVGSLSGGWQKRLALARELMKNPHVLLLDEPTNHLDIEGILWLEKFISSNSDLATMTITHDRIFLQRVSNRILELDRRHSGGILSVKGNYQDYLTTRESMLEAQENREAILRGNLRRETEWLKAGAKARTTKQQARITRAGVLAEEVNEIGSRNISRSVQMDFQAADSAPKRLLEAKKISKSYSDKLLFSDFEMIFTPGTRLGIIGENGCGKSTLIRMLLKLEEPTTGKIFHSDLLKISYFEQNKESLDPDTSLLKSVCPHGDHVIYRGKPVHIRSYLDRFLFSKEQMDLPVRALSGGEQSRVLIAKLMLQEANLMVLDEPTNDLDIATLNALQDCLCEFEGAVILVSHDRYFLDQVSTRLLAFPQREEDRAKGKLYFFEDLNQWETWHDQEKAPAETKKKTAIAPKSPSNSKVLEQLTRKIEQAEKLYAKLEEEASAPENAREFEKLVEIGNRMKEAQTKIDQLYKQWNELL